MKETDASLIDRLGGTEAVAEAMDIDFHTVKKWRYRGIPWRRRSDFADLARSLRKKLPSDFLSNRVNGSANSRAVA